MTRIPPSAFWLLAPGAMALWLLVATPSRWFGIDTGSIGAAIMLAAAWIGLGLATRIPDDPDSPRSPGEQKNWVALAFSSLIGALMIFKAGVFVNAESVADLREVGRPIGMLIVGWIIFGSLLRRRLGRRIQQDERDVAVERASDLTAYVTLCVVVMGIAVTLGFTPRTRLDWATPIALANLLVFALVLASFVGHAVAAWRYWRDRA